MPPSAASRACPSAEPLPATAGLGTGPTTPRNGMVTSAASPVSGFCVILPSNGGKVLSVLIITTAAAPAACP